MLCITRPWWPHSSYHFLCALAKRSWRFQGNRNVKIWNSTIFPGRVIWCNWILVANFMLFSSSVFRSFLYLNLGLSFEYVCVCILSSMFYLSLCATVCLFVSFVCVWQACQLLKWQGKKRMKNPKIFTHTHTEEKKLSTSKIKQFQQLADGWLSESECAQKRQIFKFACYFTSCTLLYFTLLLRA